MKKTFLISMAITIGGIVVTVAVTLLASVVNVVTPEIRCELLNDCPRRAESVSNKPPQVPETRRVPASPAPRTPPQRLAKPSTRSAPPPVPQRCTMHGCRRAPRAVAPRRYSAGDVLFVEFDPNQGLVDQPMVSP